MSISKDSKNISLDTKRHSFAHLMAAAVYDMFPDAQFGVGPVIETGCYYDFVLPRTLVPEDIDILDGKVRDFLKRDLEYKVEKMSFDEALELFIKRGQGLKCELIRDIQTKQVGAGEDEESEDGKDGTVTIWRIVDSKTGEMLFEDLCKGPHVGDFKELQKAGIKLDKFSSSYWKADEKRDSMQRIYALVFDTQAELDAFVLVREEAKQYDHRLLGQQLDLFYFSDLVGSGLPLYTAKGTVIKNKLKELLLQTSKKYGVQEVSIPHMANIKLYETSGHAAKFGAELFHVKDHYENEFVLKPVNCPHHTQIFAGKPRSYRELPIRMIESTMQYRDEKPGSIGGLTRTRGFTVDDGHTFCSVEQIKDEVVNTLNIIKDFYSSMGLWGNQWVSVSVRDYSKPEQYTGFPEDWDKAEQMLKDIAGEQGLDAKVCEGEAALYGPKIDFMYYDLQGKERQLSTVQIDFATPKRFELSYTNDKGEQEPPVMLHRAILGSYERFMAIFLENSKGRLPFWISPVQVKILTINDGVLPYVREIEEVLNETVSMKPLKYNEIRYEIDSRAESLGKKIREAETSKTPVILIVGPRDVEASSVSVRTQDGEQKVELVNLKQFLESYVG